MAAAVKTPNDHDFVIGDAIEQTVWKDSDRCATASTQDDLILEGILNDVIERCIDGTKEVRAGLSRLCIVPVGGLSDFSLRLRGDDQPPRHLRRDHSHSRTSSQGFASEGSRSC
jgi:hypothetical protein